MDWKRDFRTTLLLGVLVSGARGGAGSRGCLEGFALLPDAPSAPTGRFHTFSYNSSKLSAAGFACALVVRAGLDSRGVDLCRSAAGLSCPALLRFLQAPLHATTHAVDQLSGARDLPIPGVPPLHDWHQWPLPLDDDARASPIHQEHVLRHINGGQLQR